MIFVVFVQLLFLKIGVNPLIPSSRGSLQIVKSLIQLTHFSFLSLHLKSLQLKHVHLFIQFSIQKRCFEIHVCAFPRSSQVAITIMDQIVLHFITIAKVFWKFMPCSNPLTTKHAFNMYFPPFILGLIFNTHLVMIGLLPNGKSIRDQV